MMQVQKRNGKFEEVSFDKVKNRLKTLCNGLTVDPIIIAQKVCSQIYDNVKTAELDELSAQICISMVTINMDYGVLGSRVIISNSHKNTSHSFSETMTLLFNNTDVHGVHNPLISEEVFNIILINKEKLNSVINYDRDYNFDFFSYKTLKRAYLIKINNKVTERIQDLFMRVSVGLHKNDIKSAIDSYNFMSNKYFTHATPTLFHAGTNRPQYLSCFIKGTKLLTINNGVKNIEDVVIGDTVITHLGNNKKVLQLHKNKLEGRQLFNIKCALTPLFTTTNNHQFWSIKNNENNENNEPSWNSCEDLSKDDFIAIPNYIGHQNNYNITVGEFDLEINNDFAKLLGLWYSSGSFIINNDDEITGIKFTTDNTNNHIMYFGGKYITKIFDHNPNFNINLHDNIAVAMIYNSKIGYIFNQLFYKFYEDIFKWNNDLIYSFLGGLLSLNKNIFKIPNTNFLRSLYHLVRSRGIMASLNETENFIEFFYNDPIINEILIKNNEDSINNDNNDYNKELNNIKSIFRVISDKYIKVFNNQKFIKITDIIKYNEDTSMHEYVYNIGVEDDHSYEINGIVAKNCFLLGTEDSVQGIYKNISDCSQISKWAGGIGIHISDIRSKGTNIRKTNGTAGGIIPMLRVYNDVSVHINQSGKRNGSFAMYLEPHHPDVMDFLDIRKNHGNESDRARDLFTAIWISDLFMEKVDSDSDWSLFDPDECPNLTNVYGQEYKDLYAKYEQQGKAKKVIKARTIWAAITTAQIETGTPYISFKDAANIKSNQKGYGTIKSSNLCVAPDTLILTDKGHIKIKDIHKQKVNVWNGKEFSNVEIMKTGENQNMMKVSFSDGMEVKCTPYHKFYIQEKNIKKSEIKDDIINHKNVKVVEAEDLEVGMKIIRCKYPIINNKKELEHAYTNGFFSGDDGTYGSRHEEERPCSYRTLKNKTYCKRHINYQTNDEINTTCQSISYLKQPIVFLYHEKIKLLKYLDYTSCEEEKNKRLSVKLTVHLEDKFFIPMDYSIKSKMEWLSGYADADGCIAGKSLQIVSIKKDFLINIKLMLQTCGINSKISLTHLKRQALLPNGKGGKKLFNTKETWRILIAEYELQQLIKLGFSPKRLIIKESKMTKSQLRFITIKEVIELEDKSDTYCFTEKKRNAGVFNGILQSNCNEILEYSDQYEYACCCLASICLPKFIEDGKYNFDKLINACKVIVNNLNKVIDDNYYPVPETKKSNLLHRPLGIGVQGLSDVFSILKMAFDSPEAKQLNIDIFKTIYYGCAIASNELAKINGPYITFSKENALKHKDTFIEFFGNEVGMQKLNNTKDSPISQGLFQFDLWNVKPSDKYDWETLRSSIKEFGVRNSLFTALMPTASTSQIMSNNEAFEPVTSNIYVRRTIAGDFVVINKHLINDLTKLGLWDVKLKDLIIANQGSVQNIDVIPKNIQLLYKTVWEIKQKVIIDMAADRAPYICQTQSMNLFFNEPTNQLLTSALFYAWKKGLKTGSYYIRSKPNITAQQFTISNDIKKEIDNNNEVCESCSA